MLFAPEGEQHLGSGPEENQKAENNQADSAKTSHVIQKRVVFMAAKHPWKDMCHQELCYGEQRVHRHHHIAKEGQGGLELRFHTKVIEGKREKRCFDPDLEQISKEDLALGLVTDMVTEGQLRSNGGPNVVIRGPRVQVLATGF